jgi:predicted HTH transcriptional regulator
VFGIKNLSSEPINQKNDTVNSDLNTINPQNDTVNPDHDTVNDTLLHLIKQNGHITAKEISELLNISLSTTKRRIKQLKDAGRLTRKGSVKTGYWEVVGN